MKLTKRGSQMARIVTGIKPTGLLTLGNYIGVLKDFKTRQVGEDAFIFIADLHALTLPIEPKDLYKNTRDVAAFFLAAGLDEKYSTLFLQSQVSEHAELATILGNYAYLGELKRMTQFKDITTKLNDTAIGLGILTYPVLMAADIILYDCQIVPIGDDQRQHVELARDLVNRFNNRFGKTLVEPIGEVKKVGARIKSLSDPTKKMSKSNDHGTILLLDPPKVIEKKIMSAVTDSDTKIFYDEKNKPGIANLLTIYASMKGLTIKEAEAVFATSSYGAFKKAVVEAVLAEIIPFQERYYSIIATTQIEEVLARGKIKAQAVACKTLNRVKKAIGLLS
jgi:tryptophanyl-tRNA synthetase